MIHIPTAPWVHYIGDGLAWAGAMFGGRWLYRKHRAQLERLSRQTEPSYFVILALGGAVGAWLFGSLNTLRAATPTLSHSIAGALAGGIIAVEIWKWRRGIAQSTGGPFVVPICIGVIIGRWGCFFSGLADGTFGAPTSLPWGVDLGDGVARHPVQLYESAAMLLFLCVYLRALATGQLWPQKWGFHIMIIVYASQRFCWEFFKPYPPLIGLFNLFHLLMIGMIIYGFVWIDRTCRSPSSSDTV